MTNYKLSDFRKNLNEKGLQYALREDAKATRERHPALYGIHEACKGPGQILGQTAARTKDPTEKAVYTFVKAAGYVLGYPLTMPIAIYSATLHDRIFPSDNTFLDRVESCKEIVKSRK